MKHIIEATTRRLTLAAAPALAPRVFKGCPFTQVTAKDKAAAEKAINSDIKKSGVKALVKNVRPDPNGGWEADVSLPEADAYKFALFYNNNDKRMAMDMMNW